MSSIKRLLAPCLAFLLVVGISLAQGPKKDIGSNLPLPPEAKDDSDQKPPQKQLNLPKVKSLSVDVNLINVDVTVTDNDGHPISGLAKDQFKVFDDNVQQQITNFSLTDEPLTVAILLEFAGTFGNFRAAIPPAIGFINALRPDDWVALIAYDRSLTVMTDFTKNKNELENGLNNLVRPRFREAALYDSLYETLKMMEDIDGRKAVFLLSSGLDTADFNTHSYTETLKKTEASDIAIYAVSLTHLARGMSIDGFNSNRLAQADNALGSFAANSGGAAFFPQFAAELPGIYQTVDAQVRNQYSLGFVPTNRTADGKFHKLRVELAPLHLNANGKPDKIKIHYKQGYYAAKP